MQVNVGLLAQFGEVLTVAVADAVCVGCRIQELSRVLGDGVEHVKATLPSGKSFGLQKALVDQRLHAFDGIDGNLRTADPFDRFQSAAPNEHRQAGQEALFFSVE